VLRTFDTPQTPGIRMRWTWPLPATRFGSASCWAGPHSVQDTNNGTNRPVHASITQLIAHACLQHECHHTNALQSSKAVQPLLHMHDTFVHGTCHFHDTSLYKACVHVRATCHVVQPCLPSTALHCSVWLYGSHACNFIGNFTISVTWFSKVPQINTLSGASTAHEAVTVVKSIHLQQRSLPRCIHLGYT